MFLIYICYIFSHCQKNAYAFILPSTWWHHGTVLTYKRSSCQWRGDDHQYKYEALMMITFDHHSFETFNDDFRVERTFVYRTGRLVRFGRVVNEQEAQAQGDQVDADVQGEYTYETDFDVQIAGGQGSQCGCQWQYGRREPDSHCTVALVSHIGQIREHTDEKAVKRPGGGHDYGLYDTGGGGGHYPEISEHYVQCVAQYLPK